MPDQDAWRPADPTTLQGERFVAVGLGEVGSAETGGAKAEWIRSAFADLLSGRFGAVRAMVWFDVDKEERWALDSSQQALTAWLGTLRAGNPQIGRSL